MYDPGDYWGISTWGSRGVPEDVGRKIVDLQLFILIKPGSEGLLPRSTSHLQPGGEVSWVQKPRPFTLL